MMSLQRNLTNFLLFLFIILNSFFACKNYSSTGINSSDPDTPSGMMPANGFTDVGVNTGLKWECSDKDGDALSFEVYFDTVSPPSLIVQNYHGTSYMFDEALKRQTRYFWKIVAVDSHGNKTASLVNSFTTLREIGIYPVGHIDTRNDANDIYKIRDEIHIAEGDFGLEIADVTNPSTPTIVKNYKYDGLFAGSILVDGDYSYVADTGNNGLLIVDISDHNTPLTVAFFNLPPTPHDIALDSDLAYLACYGAGLQIVNVENVVSPVLEGSFQLPGIAVESIDILDSYVILGCMESGVYIIDVADPGAPVQIGNYDTPGIVEAIFTEQKDNSMYVHIADGIQGYRLVDFTTPTNPIEITSINLTGYAYDIWHLGDYTYITAGTNGLYVLDNSIPPNIIAHYDTPGQARGIYVTDEYIYLADGAGGVQILEFIE